MQFEHMHRAREKLMAYVLNTEFGYSKSSIARLMGVSPQQMGVWIKEAQYEVKIQRLNKAIIQMTNELKSMGYQPVKELDASILTLESPLDKHN